MQNRCIRKENNNVNLNKISITQISNNIKLLYIRILISNNVSITVYQTV